MSVSKSLRRIAVLTIALVALAFVGCSEKRSADMPNFTRCSGPSACEPGYTCRSGICISPQGQAQTSSTCSAAEDCPSGLDCVEGRCVSEMTGCSDDLECGFGEICDRGECRSARNSAGCTTDADCAGGQCINRRCR